MDGTPIQHHAPAQGKTLTTTNWDAISRRYEGAMSDLDWRVAEAEMHIGVPRAALQRLRMGIMPDKQRHTFPMRDASGKVVGIRTREYVTRAKKALTGSREGCFIPVGFSPSKSFLICEGPTDTAAMLSIGFEAMGRPSCQGGVDIIMEIVHRFAPSNVCIVADRDEHGAGQAGAEEFQHYIDDACTRDDLSVTVILPPEGIKDSRAWVLSGATKHDVWSVIRKTGGM